MVVLVKDVMTRNVLKIDQERTAKEAAEIMRKARVGSIIITKKGKPVGIVTDSDMIKKIVAKDLKASEVKLKDIMSSPLITVSPDDELIVAVRKLMRNNIHRVTVVDKGKLVGILSYTDIAGKSTEMLDLLEYRLKMKEVEPRIVEEFATGLCELCGNYSDVLRNINDQWICEDCRDLMVAEEGR